MISVRGQWYDGRTAAVRNAVFSVYETGESRVEAAGGGLLATAFIAELKISSRLADTPRYLEFPGGSKFQTDDNDAVDRVTARFRLNRWSSFLHRLESRSAYILAAMVLLVAFLVGSVKYGVPFLAGTIADHLPPSAYDLAGRQTLEVLDRSFLAPTQLDESTRGRVLNHFRTALNGHSHPGIRVLFRKGGHLGANAFALPDGTIVFTDEMVRSAQRDEELTAVLAHEVGHVVHRHGMRRMIQDSLLGFLVMALTGDVSGSSEMFLGLPVILTELAYSREFEREADDYALAFLKARRVPPVHFARLMERIREESPAPQSAASSGWRTYLSTHPALEERIRRFRPES